MKKLFSILYLFTYIFLSVGVNVIVHTCGGEATSTIATVKIEDPCGCDDESTADMCCTTVIKTIQLDDIQKVTQTNFYEAYCSIIGIIPSFAVPILNNDFSTDAAIQFSPPQQNDLHILNSVFLI